MTNEELIATIQNEIKRLKEIGGIVPLDNREQKTGYESALIDIEIFLDSLESEKPTQEGLEEELDRFIASGKSVTVDDYGTYKVSYHDFKKVARHFAEWQKEQDEKEQADLFTIVALDAAQRTKEQMLKDAVEKTVGQEEIIMVSGHPVWGKLIALTEVDLKRFEYGDRVKIIIVKE